MKLFGIDFGPDENGFQITDVDREWVEENFKWLIQVFGYPNKFHGQVLVNETFFPKTFASKTIRAEDVVADLAHMLMFDESRVLVDVTRDISDFGNIPYEMHGDVFECETEQEGNVYKIYVPNKLLRHPHRLIHCLVRECIEITLTDSGVPYDAGGDDNELFIYLAGIYYGFGVILSQHLTSVGQNSEIRWNYGSGMPINVMAFSLATYVNITGEQEPDWKKLLPTHFREAFDSALDFIRQHPNTLFDPQEVKAMELFNQADDEYSQNKFDDAIATLRKILFLTQDDHMKADVYNNIGYYYLRMRNYHEAIASLRKALEYGPEYGYANDNLGYALIMLGDLEHGKHYLDKASQTKNNDPAYTYRNLALYYVRRQDYESAEKFFQKAFQENTPVDLLEFHYAEFLLAKGEKQPAQAYLKKAAEKNEQEAIELITKIKSQITNPK